MKSILMFLKGSLCSWTQKFSCSELNFNTKKYTFLHKKKLFGWENFHYTHVILSVRLNLNQRQFAKFMSFAYIYTLYSFIYFTMCAIQTQSCFSWRCEMWIFKEFFWWRKSQRKEKGRTFMSSLVYVW